MVLSPLVVHEEAGVAHWAGEVAAVRVNAVRGFARNLEEWSRVDP